MANLPQEIRIAVIGLGYVGLPLAAEFSRHYPTTGFDVNPERISQLRNGFDSTREINGDELRDRPLLSLTYDQNDLSDANVYVVTVPTPVNEQKQPVLKPLESACKLIANVLEEGNVVIFESTVYPGATEEVCVPILESNTQLTCNQQFFVGYSPERINPGDKNHRLTSIVKVTAGSTPEAATFIDQLYSSIVSAGTHLASSIKVAEAAKVIENTQRDLNIALINELALIFNRLGVDTHEVLQAAGTKWNFLDFKPGLVGGHCISVDPYYLTYKAQEIGYHPQVILSGRQINDGMGTYIGEQVVKLLTRRKIHVVGATILILGLTFKENCPDIRNTRVIDIIDSLQEYHASVDVYDPWVDRSEATGEFDVSLVSSPEQAKYDAIVLAVGHQEFIDLGIEAIRKFGKDPHVVFDVKGVFPRESVDRRL